MLCILRADLKPEPCCAKEKGGGGTSAQRGKRKKRKAVAGFWKEAYIMPGFNGTGPAGLGPRTGGGRGFCSPGAGTVSGSDPGRGAGRGLRPFGGGRGRVFGGRSRQWTGKRGFRAAGTNMNNEIELLKQHAGILENELAAIQKRIEQLDGQKEA